jgi:hypothetical protein
VRAEFSRENAMAQELCTPTQQTRMNTGAFQRNSRNTKSDSMKSATLSVLQLFQPEHI